MISSSVVTAIASALLFGPLATQCATLNPPIVKASTAVAKAVGAVGATIVPHFTSDLNLAPIDIEKTEIINNLYLNSTQDQVRKFVSVHQSLQKAWLDHATEEQKKEIYGFLFKEYLGRTDGPGELLTMYLLTDLATLAAINN